MIQLGRNAPCHCGSGKKYKKCCLDKDREDSSLKARVNSVLKDDEAMRKFAEFANSSTSPNIAKLQDKLNAFRISHNDTGLDDFLGLSPSQVHNLIHNPIFSEGSGLELNHNVSIELLRAVPAVKMSEFILRKLNEAGTVKATADRKNLPRSFAREFNECYMECMLTKEDIKLEREINEIRSEAGARFLSELRVILTGCGWMELKNGNFSVTDQGAEIANDGFSFETFEKLILFHVVEFDWDSLSNASAVTSLLQNLVPFMLYILNSFDSDDVAPEHFSALFCKAFPHVMERGMTVSITAHIPLETFFLMECEAFFLIWFASFFGLVKSDLVECEGEFRQRKTIYRKTDLFHELLLWNL